MEYISSSGWDDITARSMIGAASMSRFSTTGSSASSGSFLRMAFTFSDASMAAASASASKFSSSVTWLRPVRDLDVICFTFDTADSASSTGLVICCSTDSASAPS